MIKTAWYFAGSARKAMAGFYLLFLIANVCMSFQPLVLSKVINILQTGSTISITAPLQWAFLYGVLTIIFWSLHGPARVIERRVAFHVYRAFITSMYQKITSMPLRWHQDHHSGNTINRINKAGTALYGFSQEQFIVIQMVVRFTMSMILLGLYSKWVLLTSLLVSFCMTLLIVQFDRVLVRLGRQINELEHRLNATLFDYISNIVTILTLRVQSHTRDEIDHRIDAMRAPNWREFTLNEWKWGLVNIALVVTQMGIMSGYIAFHFLRHEQLIIGSVIAIFQYLLLISQSFYDAASIYGRLMQRHIDLHSVDDLDRDFSALATVGQKGPEKWVRIAIKDLRFTHHEGDDVLHHLKDVNLTIERGQKIALIGSSGSGKTTLLTLLRGLYESQGVRLSIDGQVFDSLSPLAAFTTLVPQDSEIFENTVDYNLVLGTNVAPSDVERALTITTFADVVPMLPHGLSSDIRERGVNMSGGQKQRLALARGLIAARDSSLLLLDEPTSSVDLRTEGYIFDRLFGAFADKAIVASVHRLHLLPRFDSICLMRDGEIIEQGSFTDLLARQKEFYRLWQHHLAETAIVGNKDDESMTSD